MTDLITPPATAPAASACPYVGLVPFSEEQQRFFFGRERDSSLLADNLIAYRLTLVYGPSGAGKSSIMAAGVIPELRRQSDDAHGDTPSSVVVRLERVARRPVPPPPGRAHESGDGRGPHRRP